MVRRPAYLTAASYHLDEVRFNVISSGKAFEGFVKLSGINLGYIDPSCIDVYGI